ncbi:hypothetical protein ACSV4D_03680 [Flavobacterium sp. ARAG 55.4]|uniref:hypothetical protein n=1 Tax=Flavobacterium sp. ARAG 55.4 TaxID=3451357 RepID=UPI003F480808
MDSIEILEDDLLINTFDYINQDDFSNNVRENKGFGLRGNIVLTSLFIGTSVLAQSNDFNNYKVFDNATKESIECSQKIGNEISNYVDRINFLNKNFNSKYSIIENILSFKSLNNNWDGFNSIPLEIKSASNAIKLLDLIGDDSASSVKDFYPNPNGTITFEWYNEQDETVFLEIGNSTFSYYVEYNSIETKYFNKQIINEENSKLLSTFIKAI